jgi:hypothetical protein
MEESRKERERIQDEKRNLILQKENSQATYEQMM